MEFAFLDWCKKKSIRVIEKKSINYGTQFKLERGGEKASLSIFHSGKNLVQAKDHSLKIDLLTYFGKAISPSSAASTKVSSPVNTDSLDHNKQIWIGIDESGKGDFFGPLVACAVIVKRDQESGLLSLGVKDSKKLNDSRIEEMAPQLMSKLNYHCEILMPEQYNQVYSEIKNLNHLLASLHLKCAKKVYHESAQLIISDQFASDKKLLESYFVDNEMPVDILLQVPRAEVDLAVACASIIARFKFVEGLRSLRHNYGTEFPKGAGSGVDAVASDFLNAFGVEQMKLVAKTHFKTMNKILEESSLS